MEEDDGLAAELEALKAVYEGFITAETHSVGVASRDYVVRLDALPHTGGRPDRQFVGAQVLFRCSFPGYPERPPKLSIQEPVGLDDGRQAELLKHLEGLASSLVGEIMLGQLCEAAFEWLTTNNWPDGGPTSMAHSWHLVTGFALARLPDLVPNYLISTCPLRTTCRELRLLPRDAVPSGTGRRRSGATSLPSLLPLVRESLLQPVTCGRG